MQHTNAQTVANAVAVAYAVHALKQVHAQMQQHTNAQNAQVMQQANAHTLVQHCAMQMHVTEEEEDFPECMYY